MTKTRLILLGCFVVVFAAGLSTGLLVPRLTARHGEHSRFAELKLTPQQREQMNKIWSEVMGSRSGPGSRRETRLALAQERDQKISALLTEDQQSKRDAIVKEYGRKMDELDQERRRAEEEAIKRTRSILTAEQAQKYDILLKEQRDRGQGGPGGSRSPRAGASSRLTTSRSQPDTTQQNIPHGGE